jgi:galactose oxidase
MHAVLHTGPSTQMHWFGTTGKGSVKKAGTRPGGNAANGNAVMFDTGKILTCGGSEAYSIQTFPATTVRSAHACTACTTLPAPPSLLSLTSVRTPVCACGAAGGHCNAC